MFQNGFRSRNVYSRAGRPCQILVERISMETILFPGRPGRVRPGTDKCEQWNGPETYCAGGLRIFGYFAPPLKSRRLRYWQYYDRNILFTRWLVWTPDRADSDVLKKRFRPRTRFPVGQWERILNRLQPIVRGNLYEDFFRRATVSCSDGTSIAKRLQSDSIFTRVRNTRERVEFSTSFFEIFSIRQRQFKNRRCTNGRQPWRWRCGPDRPLHIVEVVVWNRESGE